MHVGVCLTTKVSIEENMMVVAWFSRRIFLRRGSGGVALQLELGPYDHLSSYIN